MTTNLPGSQGRKADGLNYSFGKGIPAVLRIVGIVEVCLSIMVIGVHPYSGLVLGICSGLTALLLYSIAAGLEAVEEIAANTRYMAECLENIENPQAKVEKQERERKAIESAAAQADAQRQRIEEQERQRQLEAQQRAEEARLKADRDKAEKIRRRQAEAAAKKQELIDRYGPTDDQSQPS